MNRRADRRRDASTAREDRKTTMRTTRLLRLVAAAATAGVATLAALLPAAPASAAGEWQDGYNDSDTILNCYTQSPSVGVSGNVGWRSSTGQVPKVGETFEIRGYVGLVSLPCSGRVATVPELLLPAGVTPQDPVRWGIYRSGEPGTLGTSGLEFYRGANGGIAITRTGDQPFTLERGQILEFHVPVVATRELKGTATPAPTCIQRREGDAPCPVASSGDHLQIAFAVGGHGGDKSYVTPYVPLFAAAAADTTAPRTSITGGPADGTVVTSTSASFTLGSSEPGSRLGCSLDGRAHPCAPGKHTVTGLAPGTHVLRARATDAAGNTDPTGAARHWTVPVPSRSFAKSSGWATRSVSSAYGGRVLHTTRKGAAVSYTVRDARRLYVVASGGTGHGTIRVYAGRRLVKTVSLRTSRSVTKRVIPVTTFSRAWDGKVRIVVATSGRTVRLEGLAAPTR